MSRKKAHTPEEIVSKLRQVDVLAGQGKAVAETVRAIGVTEATYYRWRAEWASPLGVEGLLTNPITSGGGYGGEANPAALLLSFGSKTSVSDTSLPPSFCQLRVYPNWTEGETARAANRCYLL